MVVGIGIGLWFTVYSDNNGHAEKTMLFNAPIPVIKGSPLLDSLRQ